jgi:hypothetical protein
MNETMNTPIADNRLEIHALLAAGRCFAVEFDENNEQGMKKGNVSLCNVGDISLEYIYTMDVLGGTKFNSTTYIDLVCFEIEKKIFPSLGFAGWTGNMMWNTYYLTKEYAVMLINHLIASGNWGVNEAETNVFNKLVKKQPITCEDLSACC